MEHQHRKKLRAKRPGASRQPPLDYRLRTAWETWRTILQNSEDEIIRCLDRFEHLRVLFLEDEAASLFLELGFASFLLEKIKESPNNEIIASHLFTISDLVDVDESGNLGQYFVREGLLDNVMKLWRTPEPSTNPSTSDPADPASPTPSSNSPPPVTESGTVDRKIPPPPLEPPIQVYRFSSLLGGPSRGITKLKAACLCVISGLAIHDMARIASCLEPADMDVVYSMLLTKGITALHSRCIIFVNNLFVSSIFADRIMERLVPAVMALLMYNVTNHVKLKKHREAQMLLGDVQEAQASTPHRQKKQKASEIGEPVDPASPNDSNAEAAPVTQLQSPPAPTSSENVDPLYDERLYTDFVSSACLFLGNATGSPEVCRMVEAYSIIDIMTLLFHGADHSLDALVSVVKCLANLANIRDNRPKLLDSNVLPLAVKLLQLNVQYEDLRAHLTLLVGNMAGVATAASPTLAALLSDPTLIAAICDLFVTTQVDSHERFALLALANLSLDAAVVPVLVENIYCIRKIIQCCTRTAPSSASTYWVFRQVVRLLHAIASAPQSQQLPSLLKALGAEEALKKMLSTCQAESKPSESGTPSPHAKTFATIEQLATAALAYIQAAPDMQFSLPLDDVGSEEPARVPKPTPALQTAAAPSPAAAPSAATPKASPKVAAAAATTAAPAKQAAPVITTPVSKPVMRDAPVKQPNPQKAAEEKERGNEFFHKKRFKEAIICYTRAADWSPADYTLFSNRAAAYMHLEHYELALKDAERCIEMSPTWVKGWFRKGKSLIGLEQFDAAIAALNHALEMEKGNKEIQDALRIANTRMKAKQSGVSTIVHQNPLIHHNALAALTRVPMK